MINWDSDNQTRLTIPQNKTEKAAEKLNNMAGNNVIINYSNDRF